jgi:hypothetical protein
VLEVVPRDPGLHELEIQWLADQTGQPLVELESGVDAKQSPVDVSPARGTVCRTLATRPIELAGPTRVRLTFGTQSALLDYIEARPASSKMR